MRLVAYLLALFVSMMSLDARAVEPCGVPMDYCFGYTSTTSHFVCNYCPHYSGNCVWWAASKRPDIAAVISGSGWNGGQWYDKLKNLGFSVGPIPEAGAIADFSDPSHDAYVEKANDDGSFRVSEMDAYASKGFVPGVNYATYSPNGDGTYSRNGGLQRWTLNGFIYAKDSSMILIPKGEQGVFSIGSYLFRGSDICSSASEWYKVTDSSRSDYWITESITKEDACNGVTETVERTLQSGEDNDGSPKTDDIVTNESSRSADVSWWSKIVSYIKEFLGIDPAQAATESFVQKALAVSRTVTVYDIAGTNKKVFVLTDGPGMKGDKAIDPYSGYQSDPSGTLETGLSPSSGKKLPDIGISGEWFERSSGRKHDDVDWGSTLCPTVYVRSKGDGDAPKDVKLSYFLSKGYNVDRSPRHFGYEMIAKRDMRTGRSKNVSHCVGFNDGDYPAYPGRYNFTAVANSDHAFAESKMTNNKSTAYSFVIKENAHLIAQFHFLNGVVPGQSVSVAVTISNTGTPFGQDFVYTQYRIQGPEYGENPVIIGIDQTRRDHLRTGDTANEQFSFMAPMAPGDYIVIAEVDYTGIVNQSDRSGNIFAFSFEIPDAPE